MQSKIEFDIPENFITRQRLLADIWQRLNYDSVMLIGPAGVGKTSILNYMHSHPESGFRTHYLSAENKSISEFRLDILKTLAVETDSSVSWTKTLKLNKLKNLRGNPNLNDLNHSSLKRISSNEHLLLMFDGFTEFLLQSKEADGRYLFDELRHLRMEFEGLRMLFAGRNVESLGRRYSDLGFFNDLSVISIPALNEQEVIDYVDKLSTSKGATLAYGLVRKIANLAGGSPLVLRFILDLIFKRSDTTNTLGLQDERILDSTLVKDQLSKLIHTRFNNILANATDSEVQEITRLLDALTNAGTHGLSEGELAAKNTSSEVRNALRLLEQEGFLVRGSPNRASFAHKAFLDWWKENRNLVK